MVVVVVESNFKGTDHEAFIRIGVQEVERKLLILDLFSVGVTRKEETIGRILKRTVIEVVF